MTADEEKQLEAMFAAGDPAARLPQLLPMRVAARLHSRRAAPSSFARWVAVPVALVSSVGLGAAAVFVAKEVHRPAEVVARPAVTRVVASRPAVAAPAADPLAEEAALVQASLEALQRGDADAALAKLDERRTRFPEGLLAGEAAVARLKALLLAHRDGEALAGFAELPEGDLTVPLRLTWADVLVKRGRCAEALRVLAPIEGTSHVAKAMKGSCSSRP